MNPACEYCGGPVNVSCFNGGKIRCPCGKTMADVVGSLKVEHEGPISIATIDRLANMMHEHGILSLRMPNGLAITIGPPRMRVPAATTVTPMPDAPDESCTCGHALHAHTDVGCTYGCDLDTCGLSSEAKAEATE